MLNGEYTARWGHRTVWVDCEGATYLLDVSSYRHSRQQYIACCVDSGLGVCVCYAHTASLQVGFPAKPVDIVKVVADAEQLQSNGVVIVMTHDADMQTWYMHTKSADGELSLQHRIHMQDEYKQEELDQTMQ
jgi:hypothetical protein